MCCLLTRNVLLNFQLRVFVSFTHFNPAVRDIFKDAINTSEERAKMFLFYNALKLFKVMVQEWPQKISIQFSYSYLGDHWFSTFAKFSEKITFLTHYKGVRNVSFLKNFANLLNEESWEQEYDIRGVFRTLSNIYYNNFVENSGWKRWEYTSGYGRHLCIYFLKLTLKVPEDVWWFYLWTLIIDLFHANVPLLYPLKTSENLWFSGGAEMEHSCKLDELQTHSAHQSNVSILLLNTYMTVGEK